MSILFFYGPIDANAQLTTVGINLKDACGGLQNGSIDILVTNSTGSITTNVFGPSAFFIQLTPTDAIPEPLTGLAPGAYFTITQDDNETVPFNFVIGTVATPLNVAVSGTLPPKDNTDCGVPNGTIDLDVSGGVGPYSYAWTGPNGFTQTIEDISGLEGGTYDVTVFDDGSNCFVTLPSIILVNPILDGSLTVAVVTNPICEGSSSSIDVDLSEPGVSYQLRNDADDSPVGGPVLGNGATINLPTGALTATTTFNVLASYGVCAPVELTTLATVNVDAAPDPALAISAGADPICEGSSTTIDVALSESGNSYQLRNDATDANVGPAVPGNGGTISLPTGNLLATTTFNVLVTNGTCVIELSTLTTVNVDLAPDPLLGVTAAADPICEGSSTTIDVALSESGYSYQLRNDAGNVNVGSAVLGTGGTINLPTGALTTTTSFNVLVTNGACPPTELTMLATVNVDPAPDLALGVSAAADPICEGSSTTIDVALSESGYSYQLRNDATDTNVGPSILGTGGTINLPTGALTATTTYNVLVTNGTCVVELSTLVTVNVDSAPDPALTVSVATDPICEGSSTTIDVALSESGYSYQLRNDAGNINVGAPIIGTGGTINIPTGALTASTTFNVLVTNGTCVVELNTLAMVNVDAAPDASLVVSAASNPICEGSSTTIDVELSEAGYSYQLRNDAGDINVGAPILGTGGTINIPTGSLTTTTTFNVLVTNGICMIELSTVPTVNVDAAPDPALTVSSAADPICEGTSTTIDVTLSEAGYSYQLRNDLGDMNVGAPVLGTGGTINLPTGNLTTTTIFNILVTNGTCQAELTTLATVNIDAAPDPALVVSVATSPICEGNSTTIDIGLSEFGYSYQLRNNADDVSIGAPVVGTGGSINLPTGVLATTTTFNVLVTNGTCSIELTSLASVNVDLASIAPTSASVDVATYCDDVAPANITLSYTDGTLGTGATAEWYTDIGFTTNVGNGNNLVLAAPLVTTTYFVRFEGTCGNTAAQSVTVTVDNASTAPGSASVDNTSYCDDVAPANIILTYVGGILGTGATAVWYSDAGFTMSVGSGNNLSITAPTNSTTYFVRFEGSCGNTAAQSVGVNVDIASIAPSAASVDVATYCDDVAPANITLSYADGTLGTGATAEWYTDIGLTTNVGNGNDLVLAAPFATTTYFVRFEGSCGNTAAQSVTVTVDNASIAPTNASVDIATYCEDAVPANIILSYNGGTIGTGATAEWYSDATFTTSVGGGNNLSIAAPAASMTYFVRFEGSCNITAGQSVSVDVVNLPDATITGQANVCANTTESYSAAAGAASYTWSIVGGDGVITGGNGTENITVDWGLTGGDLSLDVVGLAPTNCINNSTVSISVFSSILPLNPQTFDDCQNNTAPTLAALSLPGATVNWYVGSSATGTLVHTGNPYTPAATELDMTTPGTTIFTYTQSIACLTSTDADYTVNIIAQPNAGTNNGISVCLTDPAFDLFNELGGTPDNGGTWSDDDGSGALSGSSFDPGTAGNGTFNFTYQVDGTGPCAAQSVTAVVTVDVVTTSTPPVPDQTSYTGCAYSTPPTLNVAGAGIRWYTDLALNNLVGTGNSFTPTGGVDIDSTLIGSTIYFVTQDDGCGESAAAEVEVILEGVTAEIGEVVNTYPEQNIGAIEVVNINSDDPPYQVSLVDASGNVIYDWIYLEEDRLGQYSYLFTLLAADDYVVWVQDSKGCTYPIEQTIILETDLFIPNVFTPNGDNYNDYFKILNKSGTAQVRINNRWGTMVFKSDDYQNDWQADNLPEGVYFYTVKMNGVVYNGNVEVWRHDGPTGSN